MPHAALASACAAIIPLGLGSRQGSSSLPEGCSLLRLAPLQRERVCCNRRSKAAIAKTLTRRAGPALPSYLALHRAGFSVPHALLRERWALTPPFHPYQRIVRRHVAGFPARCHRAVPRRSIFCGTFRERIALHRRKPVWRRRVPLALPGALPLLPMTRDGVRTFLPPRHLAMVRPAITRLTRCLIVPRTSLAAVPSLGRVPDHPSPCFF